MEAANAPGATSDDLQQLRLLSIFHYVVAGITAVLSLVPVFHLVIGLALVTGRFGTPAPGEAMPFGPELFGWLFVALAAVMITAGLALAGFMVHAGRCIARRRRHTLCLVVAGVSCMLMPLGTVLGVFTLVVLTRPQVRALFQEA